MRPGRCFSKDLLSILLSLLVQISRRILANRRRHSRTVSDSLRFPSGNSPNTRLLSGDQGRLSNAKLQFYIPLSRFQVWEDAKGISKLVAILEKHLLVAYYVLSLSLDCYLNTADTSGIINKQSVTENIDKSCIVMWVRQMLESFIY